MNFPFPENLFENKHEQERRLMRLFQKYADRLCGEIKEGNMTFSEARKEIVKLRTLASEFFPGKLETFDLLYRPRFNRLLREHFSYKLK